MFAFEAVGALLGTSFQHGGEYGLVLQACLLQQFVLLATGMVQCPSMKHFLIVF
jgi:hypothetical protein